MQKEVRDFTISVPQQRLIKGVWIAFAPRTNAQHCEHGDAYQRLRTKKERDEFVRQWAARFSELSQLPYFDLCRMIVVDPMHNLFLGKRLQLYLFYIFSHVHPLGLVKTHFYHIWIKGKVICPMKELRMLHSILADVCYFHLIWVYNI